MTTAIPVDRQRDRGLRGRSLQPLLARRLVSQLLPARRPPKRGHPARCPFHHTTEPLSSGTPRGSLHRTDKVATLLGSSFGSARWPTTYHRSGPRTGRSPSASGALSRNVARMRRNSANALATAVGVADLRVWNGLTEAGTIELVVGGGHGLLRSTEVWPEDLWPKILPRLEKTLPEAQFTWSLCFFDQSRVEGADAARAF